MQSISLPDGWANRAPRATLARGLAWGLLGGVVGTVAMDLVLSGVLAAIGLPAVISFVTIGDTAAAFFARLGLELAGGVPLGLAMHYGLGLVLGALFGGAAARVFAAHPRSRWQWIVLGIVYVEILSQPILAMSPLLLPMTTRDTVTWFAISAGMHLIWGAVLGAWVAHGLASPWPKAARPRAGGMRA